MGYRDRRGAAKKTKPLTCANCGGGLRLEDPSYGLTCPRCQIRVAGPFTNANEIPDYVPASTSTKYRPPPPKHRAYDINPTSPEVIKAFLESGLAADEVGIQEFISKHYANWMRQFKKRSDADPADVWSVIIREFTDALREHGVHVVTWRRRSL